MSTALELFRQQRELLVALTQEAHKLNGAVAAIRKDLDAIARHDALHNTLQHEQRWLQRTEAAVRAMQDWQRATRRQLWPWLAWRWAGLTAFALLAVSLWASAYGWATRPYSDDIALLRSRLVFVEQLERRMLQMSSAERRQFDALLKGAGPR